MVLVSATEGRWVFSMGNGLSIEVLAVLGAVFAWYRWRGELVAEMDVPDA